MAYASGCSIDMNEFVRKAYNRVLYDEGDALFIPEIKPLIPWVAFYQ